MGIEHFKRGPSGQKTGIFAVARRLPPENTSETTDPPYLNVFISPLCSRSNYTYQDFVFCAPSPVSANSVPPKKPRLVFSLLRLMARRQYRAWTPEEERDYLRWVARHEHLTWPDRAKRYSIERKPRTKESLRTKFRLLEKDIRRYRRQARSRIRRRIPSGQDRGMWKTWSGSISISTPTPSEYSSDDQRPLPMGTMTRPVPTRIACPRQKSQVAFSTQDMKPIAKSPIQQVSRGEVTRCPSLHHPGTEPFPRGATEEI